MKKFFEKIFSKSYKKRFSTWQIELTTRCMLRCRMCARDGCDDWISADMSLDNFKKVTPYLKDVERVVLEGWGESLLNENILDIIRLVKDEGPEVGFVSSGLGLTKDLLRDIVGAGVDFMGFSISGSSPDVHNAIRINSDLQVLMNDIEILNKIKADNNLDRPKLHIVYLMLKDNISQIVDMVDLCKELGVPDLILIHIIQISNEYQDGLKVFSCKEMNEFSKIVDEAEEKARKLGINLKRPAMTPVEVTVCEENPLRNLYISVEGEVSPCVYLHPPMPSPFKRIFCGDEHSTNKLSFGNVFSEQFQEIWNKKEYVEFRKCFIKRKKKTEFSPLLMDMESLKKAKSDALPDPPRHCMTCHKMLGF